MVSVHSRNPSSAWLALRESWTHALLGLTMAVIAVVRHDVLYALCALPTLVVIALAYRGVRRRRQWSVDLSRAAARLAEKARTPEEIRLAELCMRIAADRDR